MEKEMVVYDDAAAATWKEGISGWVDINGRFFGSNEHMARYSSCTHMRCDCGNVFSRYWTRCEVCREKSRSERFKELPEKEWDGVTPICLDDGDEYFFDRDQLEEYCEEHEVDPAQLQLRICKPCPMRELEEGYFLEDLHEDAELPDGVYELIGKINEIIRKSPTACWEPDRYAAII